MFTLFPSNSHEGTTPVLDNSSVTFSRKTKALLKKKPSSEQNALVLNRTQTCQAVCTLEFCSV